MSHSSDYGEQIVHLVRRIVRLSHLQSRRMVQRFGLTGPQLMCLQTLYRRGEMTPTGLARAVELSPATVTGIIHRLEVRGMVHRTQSQVDRRSSVLTLSEKARESFATLPPALASRFSERLHGLSEFEQASLLNALRTLVDLMVEDPLPSPELLPPAWAEETPALEEDLEFPPEIDPRLVPAENLRMDEPPPHGRRHRRPAADARKDTP